MADINLYLKILKQSLLDPAGLSRQVAKDNAQALRFVAITFVLGICIAFSGVIVSTALNVISYDLDAITENIPQYQIDDGMLKLGEGVEQPLELIDGIVIDTTGKLTEPQLNADGTGILINSTHMINSNRGKTQATELLIFEDQFPNKATLVNTIESTLSWVLIVIVILFLIWEVVVFFGVSAFIWFAGFLATYITLSFMGRNPNGRALSIIGIYSLAPFLILFGIGAWGLAWFFGLIGAIWSLIIFILTALAMHPPDGKGKRQEADPPKGIPSDGDIKVDYP